MPAADSLDDLTYQQLRALAHREPRPRVELCSVRTGTYLVHLHDDTTSYQLVDDHRAPRYFHSTEEVKDLLRPLGFTQGILTYFDDGDEMVGSPMPRVSNQEALENGTRIGF